MNILIYYSISIFKRVWYDDEILRRISEVFFIYFLNITIKLSLAHNKPFLFLKCLEIYIPKNLNESISILNRNLWFKNIKDLKVLKIWKKVYGLLWWKEPKWPKVDVTICKMKVGSNFNMQMTLCEEINHI